MTFVQLGYENPVARKDHKCSMCGKTIRKGRRYTRQRNVFDGHAYTFKTCWLCNLHTTALYRLGLDDYDEGVNREGVHEACIHMGWKVYLGEVRKAKEADNEK